MMCSLVKCKKKQQCKDAHHAISHLQLRGSGSRVQAQAPHQVQSHGWRQQQELQRTSYTQHSTYGWRQQQELQRTSYTQHSTYQTTQQVYHSLDNSVATVTTFTFFEAKHPCLFAIQFDLLLVTFLPKTSNKVCASTECAPLPERAQIKKHESV